jgi:hypothetical protein
MDMARFVHGCAGAEVIGKRRRAVTARRSALEFKNSRATLGNAGSGKE